MLYVELEGAAEQLELRLYSKALVKVAALRAAGAFGPGWNRAAFALPQLATGTYYMQVAAIHQDRASAASKVARLVLLR